MPLELRDYQIQDLATYIANPKHLNLSDPGTGKTPSACVYLQYLWKNANSRTMFVMPKSLLKKNRDEILRFTDFTSQDIIIIDGNPKQIAKQIQSDAKVFLMGFRRFALSWQDILAAHPDTKAMVVDEFHMGFKSNESQATQSMYAFVNRTAKYFLAMTGTLIDGKYTTAYPAIHVIEPRYYGSYGGFVNTHAMRDSFGTILGWVNPEKLGMILRQHGIRRTFEEIHGKEAKVEILETVEMSPQQRKMFDQLQNTAMIELEDRYLSAGVEGAAVIKCRQIMAHPEHFKYDDEVYNLVGKEKTGKDQALEVHLEDHINTGKPLVVFGTFQREVERIAGLCESYGLRTAVIHGGVKHRDKIDQAFRDGQLDVIVATPATAAVGFNWQYWGPDQKEVDHVIFASMDYQDTNFFQAYRRMMRDKRTNPLRITILQYESSIDQRLLQIVKKKSKEANAVDPTRKVISVSS